MKALLTASALLALISLLPACKSGNKTTPASTVEFKKIPVAYPATRKDSTVSDTYFGKKISDPYRWLEDDQSAETKDWVAKQNIVTNGYLSQIPYREKLKKRIEQIFNFEKYSPPFKKAGKYYFFKNDGLQNQSVLYVQDDLNSQARMVLDPNTFSADGTSSLGEYAFSKDGKYLCYTVSKGGSDWRTIFVRDLATGQNLPDQLEWAKFTGLGWQGDGFYYTRYPEPKKGAELTAANKFGSVYFHRLGDPQSKDQLIYADKAHPDRSFSGGTTDDERFLYVTGFETTSGNVLYVKDLASGQKDFAAVSTSFEHDFSPIDNIGDQVLVMTNNGAPNQRLILVNPAQPDAAHWRTIVPEDSADVLRGAAVCGGKIVCTYLHHASSSLRVFDLEGKFIKEVKLPEIGSV
ncbi:MAG TPA: S9 family peptidase, partial [Saprospiraceae bacterium]|nr:S9 family peptidase [Saprospiraceae bacterium]